MLLSKTNGPTPVRHQLFIALASTTGSITPSPLALLVVNFLVNCRDGRLNYSAAGSHITPPYG